MRSLSRSILIIITGLMATLSIIIGMTFYSAKYSTASNTLQSEQSVDPLKPWKHVATIGEYNAGQVLLSHDARYIAVAFKNSTIRIYDTESLEIVSEFTYPDAELQGIRWINNPAYEIQSIWYDGNLRVWDAITGELKSKTEGTYFLNKCSDDSEYQGECIDGLLSPNEKLVYIDGEIRDIDGNFVAQPELPEHYLIWGGDARWSQDGTKIAFIVHDSGEPFKSHNRKTHIEVWELTYSIAQTEPLLRRTNRWDAQLDGAISGMAWHDDGRLFAIEWSLVSQEIKLVNVIEQTTETIFQNHQGGIGIWSPDSQLIATGYRNRVTVTDFETQDVVYTRFIDNVYAKQFSPDGRYLAIAGAKSGLIIWDRVQNKETQLPNQVENSYGFAWHPDSNRLITDSDPIQMWDIEKRKVIQTIDFQSKGYTTISKISPDGRYLSLIDRSSEYEATPIMIDLETNLPLDNWDGLMTYVAQFDWSMDGQYIAFTGNHLMQIWKFDNLNPQLLGEYNAPYSPTPKWHPSKLLLLVSTLGDDFASPIYQMDSETNMVHEINLPKEGEHAYITDSWTRSGNIITHVDYRDTAIIDMDSLEEIERFNQITNVSFAPDGTTMLSFDDSEGAIKVWQR